MFLTVRDKKKIRCLEIELSGASNSEIQFQFSGPSVFPPYFFSVITCLSFLALLVRTWMTQLPTSCVVSTTYNKWRREVFPCFYLLPKTLSQKLPNRPPLTSHCLRLHHLSLTCDLLKKEMVMIHFDKLPSTAFGTEDRTASLGPRSLQRKVNSWKKTESLPAKE